MSLLLIHACRILLNDKVPSIETNKKELCILCRKKLFKVNSEGNRTTSIDV